MVVCPACQKRPDRWISQHSITCPCGVMLVSEANATLWLPGRVLTVFGDKLGEIADMKVSMVEGDLEEAVREASGQVLALGVLES